MGVFESHIKQNKIVLRKNRLCGVMLPDNFLRGRCDKPTSLFPFPGHEIVFIGARNWYRLYIVFL